VIAASTAIACARPAAAQVDTVYIDIQNPVCREFATGTVDDPYCGIQDAVEARQAPGVCFVVRPGTYREQVTLPASGYPDHMITFLAAPTPGNPVVIDGADDFSDPNLWAPAGGDVWRAASVTWIPRQVRAHGARLTPWAGAVDSLPPDGWEYVPGAGVYVNLGGDPSTQDVHIGRRRYGFYLPNREYIRIEGFTILEPDDRGVQLNFGSNHDEIVNNVVRWSKNIGIQAIGTRDSRIAGNVVSECGSHGISLTTGSTGCTIEGNESSLNADPAKRRANGLYMFGCPGNVVRGNKWHHNQDSGQQVPSGSDSVISIQNISWANGDHGFDHLHAKTGVTVGDVAFGNFKDGFSFEGNSSGHVIYNSIAIDNGLTSNEADLWVDDSSMVAFQSNANIFWNSTPQQPIKRGMNRFSSLADWADSSGQDHSSLQSDPLFADPEAGDFHLKEGSPAIDNAETDVPFWPATDASGMARADDPQTANTGVGPTSFADRGAYEYQPQGTTTAGAPGSPARDAGLLIRPNPMRVEAEIRFDTRRDGALTVALYDLSGRCVRTLRSGGRAAAGTQRFTLNARAGDGRPLEAGVYFVRVQGPDGVRSSRLLVLH